MEYRSILFIYKESPPSQQVLYYKLFSVIGRESGTGAEGQVGLRREMGRTGGHSSFPLAWPQWPQPEAHRIETVLEETSPT